MSKANLDTVRAGVAAWNRGDWDSALRDASPDVVLDNSSNAGEWRGVHHGREAIKRMWDQFVDPWESVEMRIEEMVDAGDRVVARLTAVCHGRDGVRVEARLAWVYVFRDDKLAELVAYDDPAEARAVAGLGE